MSFINHVLHMTSQYLCISTCISMMLLNILFLDDIFCFETSVTSSKLILEKGFPPISLTSKEKIHLFPRKTFRRIKNTHRDACIIIRVPSISFSVYSQALHCVHVQLLTICVFLCLQQEDIHVFPQRRLDPRTELRG